MIIKIKQLLLCGIGLFLASTAAADIPESNTIEHQSAYYTDPHIRQLTDSLKAALEEGDEVLSIDLLDQGADLLIPDSYNRTPIYHALRAGKNRNRMVALVLDEAEKRDQLKEVNGPRKIPFLDAFTMVTPLVYALTYNYHISLDPTLLDILIEHTGDIDWLNEYNRNNLPPNYFTPLMLAVRNGDREVAEKLIKKGANINAKVSSIFYHSLSGTVYSCRTPLMTAATEGDDKMIDLLLDNGADSSILCETNSNMITTVTAAGRYAINKSGSRSLNTLIKLTLKAKHNGMCTYDRAAIAFGGFYHFGLDALALTYACGSRPHHVSEYTREYTLSDYDIKEIAVMIPAILFLSTLVAHMVPKIYRGY